MKGWGGLTGLISRTLSDFTFAIRSGKGILLYSSLKCDAKKIMIVACLMSGRPNRLRN